MAVHFDDALDKDNIAAISSKFGFSNHAYIEKFIMDFKINYHISQKINCFLRGGMCMPFYSELKVRRLSIDIDLITRIDVDLIDRVMEDLNNNIPDVKILKHHPRNPLPIPHLASYNVEYNSCLGKPEKIKIDCLCNVDIDLPTTSVSPDLRVMDFRIGYSPKILTRGALIGDKVTTLSIGTIGVPESRLSDIPKQIYDIATLLKSASSDDLKESLDVFEIFTKFKVKIYDNGSYTVDDVISALDSSFHEIISFQSALTIAEKYKGPFGMFAGTYLGSAPYSKVQQITDALLVWYYSAILKKLRAGRLSKDEAASEVLSTIQRYGEIRNSDADEKRLVKESLLKEMHDTAFNKNVLNGALTEQILFVSKIHDLSST